MIDWLIDRKQAILDYKKKVEDLTFFQRCSVHSLRGADTFFDSSFASRVLFRRERSDDLNVCGSKAQGHPTRVDIGLITPQNNFVFVSNRPFALRGRVTLFLWKWKLYDFTLEKRLLGHILNKIIMIWFFKPAPFSWNE